MDFLRRRYQAAGLYGHRISAHHQDDPTQFPAPPHFANLVIVEGKPAKDLDSQSLQGIYLATRPYGGILCLNRTDTRMDRLVKALPKAVILESGSSKLLVKKEGALPGSADWSHQYGDAGQSVVSKDNTVKAPLGLLWFGGPSNAKILPRHGHGPSPQVAGGRLFIEGADIIRAVDVYTGRLLWERESRTYE